MVSRIKKTSSKGSIESQQWQAESDASVMVTYQEIMGDKARMRRAINMAKTRALELTKRANAMQSVARTTSKKK